jgi:hypothetical protein
MRKNVARFSFVDLDMFKTDGPVGFAVENWYNEYCA